MNPRPFATTPMKSWINIRDLVSFDIKNIHSLDPGRSDCDPIPDDVQTTEIQFFQGSLFSNMIIVFVVRLSVFSLDDEKLL
jgi:hypothetical protein